MEWNWQIQWEKEPRSVGILEDYDCEEKLASEEISDRIEFISKNPDVTRRSWNDMIRIIVSTVVKPGIRKQEKKKKTEFIFSISGMDLNSFLLAGVDAGFYIRDPFCEK